MENSQSNSLHLRGCDITILRALKQVKAVSNLVLGEGLLTY
jgi:hypothetical protein